MYQCHFLFGFFETMYSITDSDIFSSYKFLNALHHRFESQATEQTVNIHECENSLTERLAA